MKTFFDIFFSNDFVFLFIVIGIIFSFTLHIFIDGVSLRYFYLFYSSFIFFHNFYYFYSKVKVSSIYNKFNIEVLDFNIFPTFYSFGKNIDFYIVVDNISIIHLIITAFVIFICFIHITFNLVTRYNLIVFFLFVIQLLLYIAFSCPNLFIFYMCFEATLIPFFFIISIWGSRREFKISSAFRLIFYTIFFSAPLFIFIIYLFSYDKTFEFTHYNLFTTQFDFFQKIFIFFVIFSFFVKIPLIPFHAWLPDAHSEAPTIGSMLLAGIILKLGTYGLYRIIWPYFSFDNSIIDIKIFIISFSIFTIISSCFLLVREVDLKRIIALYSINHMSFVVLGFCINHYGIVGGIVINASHCLSSIGLFFLIGQIYSRVHSRIITDIRNIVMSMPIFSFFVVVFFLANISFPITLNFIGEFSVISSSFSIINFEDFINVSKISFFFSYIWYFTIIFSIILVGIISVRLITIILFASDFYTLWTSKTDKVFRINNFFFEDAKVYEISIILVFILVLIFSSLFFKDISFFFDPKLSYSNRIIF